MRAASTLVALVVAAAPAGAEPTADRAPVASTPAERVGLALGIELGEPTSVTASWFAGTFGLVGAIGSGTVAGPGVSAHLDAQFLATRLSPAVSLRLGLGGRYYHHGYDAMSIDELPDSHYGVRGSVDLVFDRGPVQLYVEAAPGVDLKRTRSCSFAGGADTICPHAQASPLFIQLVAGARWFLSH